MGKMVDHNESVIPVILLKGVLKGIIVVTGRLLSVTYIQITINETYNSISLREIFQDSPKDMP